MECKNFSEVHICNSSDWTRLTRFIRKGGKLTRAVYAGLIVCFVPSVLCQGWSRHLTFDEIYNDTNYVQLQQRPRVYELPEYNYNLGNSHVYNSGEDDRFISHKYNLEDGRRPETHVYNLENVRNQVTSGYDNEDDRRLAPHLYNLENNKRNPNIHIFYPDHERRKPIPQKNSLEGGRKLPANDYSIEEDIRENEVDVDVTGTDIARVSLLVGFSHDPFRYSVPQEDYLKGVRNVSPMTLMRGDRSKRGVLHLYNMMSCATGCEPLSYKGYGCYCGFLGSGRPTDGIDSCCKMHDQCYENLYCPFFTVYFQPYYWKCYKGRPLCALENAHSQHQFINGCAARLCECDRQFAMCVRRFPCPRRRALCHSSPIRLLQNLLMFR